jgi:ABC-type dipeptide/oligopeptide/nickel transport system permease component
VLVLLGVSVIIFTILAASPGDAATTLLGMYATPDEIVRLRHQMGLDMPPVERYFSYMGGVLTGNFGTSAVSSQPVLAEIASRFPFTAQLAIAAIAIAAVFGIPLGVIAAVRRGGWIDYAVTLLSLIGISMPIFWLGLVLIYVFAIGLGWFPSGGTTGLASLVLPAITVALPSVALIARVTRASMSDVLAEDFLRTARAKGLGERLVIRRHAVPNAFNPILTVVGLQLGTLLGGTVVTEVVFARPGIGTLLLNAVEKKDVVVVQSTVLITAAVFIGLNLIVDVLYAVIDPRVRVS